MKKEISVVLYPYQLTDTEWRSDVDLTGLADFLGALDDEFNAFGIRVTFIQESDVVLKVRGYADLLNVIRLRSPADHIGNLCLGHVLGQSANCDFFEDLRRGISRLAFAPEMIEPEGSNKVVCHNCGCGC